MDGDGVALASNSSWEAARWTPTSSAYPFVRCWLPAVTRMPKARPTRATRPPILPRTSSPSRAPCRSAPTSSARDHPRAEGCSRCPGPGRGRAAGPRSARPAGGGAGCAVHRLAVCLGGRVVDHRVAHAGGDQELQPGETAEGRGGEGNAFAQRDTLAYSARGVARVSSPRSVRRNRRSRHRRRPRTSRRSRSRRTGSRRARRSGVSVAWCCLPAGYRGRGRETGGARMTGLHPAEISVIKPGCATSHRVTGTTNVCTTSTAPSRRESRGAFQ